MHRFTMPQASRTVVVVEAREIIREIFPFFFHLLMVTLEILQLALMGLRVHGETPVSSGNFTFFQSIAQCVWTNFHRLGLGLGNAIFKI